MFLSFRGEETRHSFTSNLYNALEKQGVRVFLDERLRRGVNIASDLFEAIENSAASIVIIPPNYVSSRWCLQELSKIFECRRLILPVFYLVDPSDVRKHTGSFTEHLKKHENRCGKEEVLKWREALEKAAALSGWVFDRSNEGLVRRLIRQLSCKNIA